MVQPYIISIGVLTIVALVSAYVYSVNCVNDNIFTKIDIIEIGMDNPTLWLYYDQSDVNSRWWTDFGARSSRVLNTPFLNLCYQSIVKYNGQTYNVKVLAGLSDVAILLGGWKELPKSLQNPIAPVGEAEINYIRARILRQFGGLWVNPSTIFVNSLPDFSNQENIVLFGTDKDESYADKYGTSVPGTDIMYSPANHHLMVLLEEESYKRLERFEGGKQFRKDIKWDMFGLIHDYPDGITYLPEYEFARKPNGRRIQLEDLLSTNVIPLTENAVYVPLDYDELQNRRNFGWFLRMNEEQILVDNNLFISQLFNRATYEKSTI
jgi:hypothetical protein